MRGARGESAASAAPFALHRKSVNSGSAPNTPSAVWWDLELRSSLSLAIPRFRISQDVLRLSGWAPRRSVASAVTSPLPAVLGHLLSAGAAGLQTRSFGGKNTGRGAERMRSKSGRVSFGGSEWMAFLSLRGLETGGRAWVGTQPRSSLGARRRIQLAPMRGSRQKWGAPRLSIGKGGVPGVSTAA